MTKEERRELWRARVEDFRGSSLTVFLPVTLTHSMVPISTAASVMEIRLLSGRAVILSAPVDTSWLRTLVQILETPCG